MNLTREETAFLKNYRRLTEYERGRVDALLDYMAKDEKKRGFKLCEEQPPEEEKK